MRKYVIALLCTALAATSTAAAPNSDWKAVSKALNSIYTHTGKTVLQRLKACNITPKKNASWVEVLTADKPEYAAKKGDTIVMIKMDFPKIPAMGGYPARNGLTNVTGLWVIGKNKGITPVSTWAGHLVYNGKPLSLDYGLKC